MRRQQDQPQHRQEANAIQGDHLTPHLLHQPRLEHKAGPAIRDLRPAGANDRAKGPIDQLDHLPVDSQHQHVVAALVIKPLIFGPGVGDTG